MVREEPQWVALLDVDGGFICLLPSFEDEPGEWIEYQGKRYARVPPEQMVGEADAEFKEVGMADEDSLLDLLRRISDKGGPVRVLERDGRFKRIEARVGGAENWEAGWDLGKPGDPDWASFLSSPERIAWVVQSCITMALLEDLASPDSDPRLNYVCDDAETNDPGWFADSFKFPSDTFDGRPSGFGASPALAAARAWLAAHA